jgi:hypothetical protein
LQDLKHDDPRISTENGIIIDLSVDPWKAFASTSFNDDGDSNEIDESDSQNEKHDIPRISTENGIIIDISPDDVIVRYLRENKEQFFAVVDIALR